jgi:hypothetical protein
LTIGNRLLTICRLLSIRIHILILIIVASLLLMVMINNFFMDYFCLNFSDHFSGLNHHFLSVSWLINHFLSDNLCFTDLFPLIFAHAHNHNQNNYKYDNSCYHSSNKSPWWRWITHVNYWRSRLSQNDSSRWNVRNWLYNHWSDNCSESGCHIHSSIGWRDICCSYFCRWCRRFWWRWRGTWCWVHGCQTSFLFCFNIV